MARVPEEFQGQKFKNPNTGNKEEAAPKKKPAPEQPVQGKRPGWRERLENLTKQGADETIYEENKRMLYELTKAAFVHAELRADLVPLVRLGHTARVASRDLDLRGLVIRTAYATKDPALKKVLLDTIVASKRSAHRKQAARARGLSSYRGAFQRWVRGRKFRNPDTGNENVFVSLPDEERARIYQEWQQGRLDWAQRHKPEGLGPETRITNSNFGQIQRGDVIWRSDSPVKLHMVTRVDRSGEGWRANNPTLTMVQFDRGQPPPELAEDHRDQEGEKRHLSQAFLRNQMLEYHNVPGQGARADRDRARAALPQEPQGGWPKFQDVGLSEGKREKIQEAFKGMQDVRDPAEVSLGRIKTRLNEALDGEAPRKAVKEFMHELRDWAQQLTQAAAQGGAPLRAQAKKWRAMQLKLDQGISRLDGDDRSERRERREEKQRFVPNMDTVPPLYRDRWDAEQRGKMAPIFGRAYQQMAQTGEFDADAIKGVLKKLKDAGVDVAGAKAPGALGLLKAMKSQIWNNQDVTWEQRGNMDQAVRAVGEDIRRRVSQLQDQAAEQEQQAERRQEGPRRHQDRAQLRGGGRKQMSAKAKLPSFFIGKVLPVGASDEAKATAKEQLKRATYADLEVLRAAAAWIDSNWDDQRAQEHPLVQHLGYDREGLKKLKKLLKRKLGDVNGRQYHDDVKNMANKYDLESEDADALYDWRVDKPARGRALSDQEKMSRFLAKAKPETKERMQGMSLADFMVMYKAILKEVLEEDEEVAEAA
jgi:hypothetical protein